jgi:hypothetical protein
MKMSDRERENDMDAAVDPPENQPGGNLNLEERTEDEKAAVDPPENQPGGGR